MCLQQGKQAIVLIPEIALTYQTVRRFYNRFGASGVHYKFKTFGRGALRPV